MAGGAGEDVGTDVVAATAVDVVVDVDADDADDDDAAGIGPFDCIVLGTPPKRPPAAAGDRCG